MGWSKVADPVLRWKAFTRGNAVRAAGGDRSGLIVGVTLDWPNRGFSLWFEDLGSVPLSAKGLPGYWHDPSGDVTDLNPMDYAPVVHAGRLKLFISHWPGVAVENRHLYILDTGYQYAA